MRPVPPPMLARLVCQRIAQRRHAIVILVVLAFAALPFCSEVAGADALRQQDAAIVLQYGLEESSTPVREREGWAPPRRILVAGALASQLAALRQIAPGVEFVIATPGDLAAQSLGVDVVLGMCAAQSIAAGKNIRWVQVMFAGVEDCVAIPGMRERNILLTNMQHMSSPVIAEHALALMLALARGLDQYMHAQARSDWNGRRAGRQAVGLLGKTVFVNGLGGIGTEVAKRAHALGMTVTATRARGRAGPPFVSYVGRPGELTKLAAAADFVVNAAPLTPRTTNVFDAAVFSAMKPTAFFINVARGGSVVTEDLIAALRTGKIAGAGLDVTEPEPLPASHPLWRAPNVIITPHVASDSDAGRNMHLAVVRENLRRYIAGDKMLSVVDLSRGY